MFVGYWTVLIANLKKKKIFYYDPIGIEDNYKNIKKNFTGLLKKEITGQDLVPSVFFQGFTYKNYVENDVYDHIDSGVCVLKQIYKIFIDKKDPLDPNLMNGFRHEILFLLFKHGHVTDSL